MTKPFAMIRCSRCAYYHHKTVDCRGRFDFLPCNRFFSAQIVAGWKLQIAAALDRYERGLPI